MESHIFLNNVAQLWTTPQDLLGRVPEVHTRRVRLQATVLPQQPEPSQQTNKASTAPNGMAANGATHSVQDLPRSTLLVPHRRQQVMLVIQTNGDQARTCSGDQMRTSHVCASDPRTSRERRDVDQTDLPIQPHAEEADDIPHTTH